MTHVSMLVDFDNAYTVKTVGAFSMDAEGYIYYNEEGSKPKHIEHFDNSDQLCEEWVADAMFKINHLKAIGFKINSNSFVWCNDLLSGLTPDCPYLPLLRLTLNFYQHGRTVYANHAANLARCPEYPVVTPDDSVLFIYKKRAWRFKKGEPITTLDAQAHEVNGWYHVPAALHYHTPEMGQAAHLGYVYTTTSGLLRWLDHYVGAENVGPLVAFMTAQ